MKGLWDHTRVPVQLCCLWLLQHTDTPGSQTSSFLTTKEALPCRARLCSCCLPQSHGLARHTPFSQCVWAVGSIFQLHRKSCQRPPWSCIAIFCSSRRPAPRGWQWHMALVQMAELLPWQAARYLGVLFANLTFYFISNRGKCRVLLLQSFLLFSFLGIQSYWNYFRVNGHWFRALRGCWQECFCSFSLTCDSGKALWRFTMI